MTRNKQIGWTGKWFCLHPEEQRIFEFVVLVFFTLNMLIALGNPKHCSALLLTQHGGEGCTDRLEQLQEGISSCFARGYYCNFWELVSKAAASMNVSYLLSMKNSVSIVS